MKFSFLFFTLVSLCLGYEAKVLKIIDGDTIKVLYKNKEQTIRLFGINAPEKKEPYFGKSKQILTKKINRKKVEIEHLYYDKYKRSVSKVFLRNKDISKFMVKNGHAIAFRKYSKDYIRDENYAKNKKLGLWNKAQ